MIRIIKKQIEQILEMPGHLGYIPKSPADPEYNLSELVKLSKRPGSGFKITGDHKKFTVVSKSALILSILTLLYLIFTIGLSIYMKSIALWIITAAAICIFILALKFGSLLFYNITVDTQSRKITVESNNMFGFIGKWIRPGFDIDFSRFQKCSSETKVRRGRADIGAYLPRYINRIYMEYDQQKRPVIDLKDEINHHIFMICLTGIIKNSA